MINMLLGALTLAAIQVTGATLYARDKWALLAVVTAWWVIGPVGAAWDAIRPRRRHERRAAR
jgi:hypothetical protein